MKLNFENVTRAVIAFLCLFLGAMTILLNAQPDQGFYCARYFKGKSNDVKCNAIQSDADGNTYATGYFTGSFDFDPGQGEYFLTANKEDIFIARFNRRGNLDWVKQFGSKAEKERGRALALDNSNHIIMTGYCAPETDFDPEAGILYLLKTGLKKMFTCKLTTDGQVVWVRQAGGESVAVDESGNIFTTGVFNGIADFDPGDDNFKMKSADGSSFITKLDKDGNFVWARQVGDLDAIGLSIALDKNANIYTIGSFGQTADFNPGPDKYILNAKWESTYICKMDSAGGLVWARGMACSGDYPYSITVDASNNVYVSGTFQHSGDFDPSTGMYSMITDGDDEDQDVFIAKLNANGEFIWTRQIGGNKLETSNSLALDYSGNVVITGFFSDTTDFNPGPEKFDLVSGKYNKKTEELSSFLCKLDSAGNFIAAVMPGGFENPMFDQISASYFIDITSRQKDANKESLKNQLMEFPLADR